MRRRTEGQEPDLFESFADTDDAAEPEGGLPPARTLARSAGVTVVLMVLASLGFIGAAWLASRHTPDVQYTSLFWEGLVLLVWGGLWGLLGGAGALSVGVVAVALPWVRRQRARS
ncbi:hypothetical protein [Phycicoccus flavus]|uniref:hypothetical protein n=1 Tax=Phycicoccus flavus TaxID=2502783 RepID=UPI000FEBAB18|nr:hypothetical protein [Phycicoccus flavus]NHA66522.1 hypothetical protein [Phycicoccus flavus]